MPRNNTDKAKKDRTEALQRRGTPVPLPVLSQTSDRAIISTSSNASQTPVGRNLLYAVLRHTDRISQQAVTATNPNAWMPSEVASALLMSVRTRIDGRRDYEVVDVKAYLRACHLAWSWIYWLESLDALQNTQLYDPYVFSNEALYSQASNIAIVQSHTELIDCGDVAAKLRVTAEKSFYLPQRVHQVLQRTFGAFLSLPREQASAKLFFAVPPGLTYMGASGNTPTGPVSLSSISTAFNTLLGLLTSKQIQFGIDYRSYLASSTPMAPLNTVEFDMYSYLFYANASWRLKLTIDSAGQAIHIPSMMYNPGAFKAYSPTVQNEELIYAVEAHNWYYGGCIYASIAYQGTPGTIVGAGPTGESPFLSISTASGQSGGVFRYPQLLVTTSSLNNFASYNTLEIQDVRTFQCWDRGSFVYYADVVSGMTGFTDGQQPTFDNILRQVTLNLYLS